MFKTIQLILIACWLLVPSYANGQSISDFEDTLATRSHDAEVFFRQIKTAILNDQREEMARLVRYPLTVNGEKSVPNAKVFVQNYDAIINSYIKKSILVETVAPWPDRDNLFMLAEGCLWFRWTGDSQQPAYIEAINNIP